VSGKPVSGLFGLTHIPAVSVVLPTFNRASTVLGAIESVFRQTFSDIEVIVVDDGSQDETADVLSRIADPRLRIEVLTRNVGAGGARNAGIRLARAPWVAFQDSDDEWLPFKLERQMEQLVKAGPGYVASYCGMAVVGGLGGGNTGRMNLRYVPDAGLTGLDGDIRSVILRESFVSTQTLVARRDTLLQVGGFDHTLPALEDWELVLRLAQQGLFAFVDDPLVMQRFSPNSITRSNAKRAQAHRQIVEKHLALFSRDPQALSHHYRSIAGAERQLGQIGSAARTMRQAIRIRPGSAVNWLVLAYLTLRSITGLRTL
jgi:glycosyltransferase involved in cell wall biosynthesis